MNKWTTKKMLVEDVRLWKKEYMVIENKIIPSSVLMVYQAHARLNGNKHSCSVEQVDRMRLVKWSLVFNMIQHYEALHF